ncbi:DUF92 domain-containing protein [Bacteroidota bacterium]|nr:DUF92 domain-containing protein [Balneolaceae bacterium]MDA0737004.1 DUF92 domain-containing protein [Bacteroidota bacterium]MBL6916870.1 DUF92 domain-containing protein [Balneolaceae bacterium]MDA1126390.1 DUF92 domain-containing protein [Bacteroidota bacterium]MDC0591538.1 DUF92 domain-containing protein [Balneolaceae bacterium]
MIDRITNIFLLFLLILGFVAVADAEVQQRILWAIVAGGVFGALSFFLNWLTLDGSTSAWLLGVITFGIAGIEGAAILLFFFISSSLLSKNSRSLDDVRELKFRRTGAQVWANGFWFGFFTLLGLLVDLELFKVAAYSSLAFATSDTWASEIGGNRIKGTTWSINGFQKVPPGTDGAISIAGTFAAVGGALSIGVLVGVLLPTNSLVMGILVASTGLVATFMDSWLGAHFQDQYLVNSTNRFFSSQFLYVGNNTVNWLSAGLASLLTIVIYLIIQQ